MNKKQLIQSLVKGIQLDIKGYTLFNELLDKQKTMLQRHDTPGLQALNQKHDKLLLQLQHQAAERQLLLGKLNLTADAQGMERVFASLESQTGAKVQALWKRLEKLATACKHQNDINGRILASQKELIDNLINPVGDEYQPGL